MTETVVDIAPLPEARGRPYAILDVETTGLDPRHDAIIQVAVLVPEDSGRTAQLWSSLVRPARPVPPEILDMTGITTEELAVAPSAATIGRALREVLGSRAVVGHHVAFDLAFLARWDLMPPRILDTLEWARVAFPRRPSHRLEDLADLLPPVAGGFHDARTDVQATALLMTAIRDRLRRLALSDRTVLAALLPAEWTFWGIEEAATAPTDPPGALWRPGPEPASQEPPPPVSVSLPPAAETLGPTGPLAVQGTGWEVRPGQVELARAVEDALNTGQLLMAEAATGIGKSLAYLMPALVRAASNGERVVVATNTVALQDQLWQKDVPQALAALDLAVPVALMKGRARYLCLLKADAEVAGPQATFRDREEALAWASLVVWLTETEEGEADEWTGKRLPAGAAVWERVQADREACAGPRCPYAGPCFLRRSRRRAQESWLVVTNHAQLLTHAARRDVLPPFQHLVVDEAHRLPEVADQVFGLTLPLWSVARHLREWAGERSVLARVHEAALVSGAREAMDRFRLLADTLGRLETQSAAVLGTGLEPRAVRAQGPALARYQERVGPVLDEAREESDRTRAALREWLADARETLGEDAWNLPHWLAIRRIDGDLNELADGLATLLTPDPEWVDWWEIGAGDNPTVTFRRAPLNPAALLRERLWQVVPGGRVLVSATLTTGGRWDYFTDAAGVGPDARRLLLPSPFRVDRQAILAIADDMPDPRDATHLTAVAEVVEALARGTDGRTLVLTTSRQATTVLDELLRDPLNRAGIRLLTQGRDGAARRLARTLAETPGTVLLGTQSLWEGIDVPGPALTTVVVTRLPFRYVGDPLEEARREALEAAGRSAFRQRSLPDAVLRFRQGFGRLLRSTQDFGAVVVLDPRMRPGQHAYGRVFVASVPGPAVLVAPAAELVPAVVRFVREKMAGGDG